MNDKRYPPFSVVLPVYRGDNPEYFDTAVESLASQTVTPDEVIVVEDGPLTDPLDKVLSGWCEEFPGHFRRCRHESNQGLSVALQTGVKAANHALVGRMDADDVSVPDRFETQLDYLTDHPETDVVGGYIAEFATNPSDIDAIRKVPLEHDAIRQQARFRSPMNHGSVIFRRDRVLDVGNYRPVDRMEDYGLWVRLLLDGATFANVPKVLLKVRAGNELYGRRGGWEYAREEIRIHTDFYRWGFTTLPVFLFNLVSRTTLRLMPNRLRGLVYQLLAREGTSKADI
ncbi:glycosyltransferase [Natrinema hispanicum]|uniref:Glycosyl transferase family 2 n=1 Tax=Natrinema hispanicum TaxID=392421 RepID=A0A1G6URH6_9EURY|nr:glycosyltransferase [Natrinema hispanicum]SDD43863.1 Glycosyl transferase family 2 [Natrinema hispanicum]